MINVDDELLHIDNEYSETEIFLKYGVVSLMFYAIYQIDCCHK